MQRQSPRVDTPHISLINGAPILDARSRNQGGALNIAPQNQTPPQLENVVCSDPSLLEGFISSMNLPIPIHRYPHHMVAPYACPTAYGQRCLCIKSNNPRLTRPKGYTAPIHGRRCVGTLPTASLFEPLTEAVANSFVPTPYVRTPFRLNMTTVHNILKSCPRYKPKVVDLPESWEDVSFDNILTTERDLIMSPRIPCVPEPLLSPAPSTDPVTEDVPLLEYINQMFPYWKIGLRISFFDVATMRSGRWLTPRYHPQFVSWRDEDPTIDPRINPTSYYCLPPPNPLMVRRSPSDTPIDFRRQILRAWCTRSISQGVKAHPDTDKERRTNRLIDQLRTYPGWEFGTHITFATPAQTQDLVVQFRKWIVSLPDDDKFEDRILAWLGTGERVNMRRRVALELIHMYSDERNVRHAWHVAHGRAFEEPAPQGSSPASTIESLSFLVLLIQILTYVPRKVHGAWKALDAANKVGDAYDQIKSAIKPILDPILDILTKVKELFEKVFTTCFKAVRESYELIKILLVWLATKFTAGYDYIVALPILSAARALILGDPKAERDLEVPTKSDKDVLYPSEPPKVRDKGKEREHPRPHDLMDEDIPDPVPLPLPLRAKIAAKGIREKLKKRLSELIPQASDLLTPKPQFAGADWIALAVSGVFGTPVERFSLPAFRTGASALIWLGESIYGIFCYCAGWVTGTPFPATVFENEILTRAADISELCTKAEAMSLPELKRDLVMSARHAENVRWRDNLLTVKGASVARLNHGWTNVLQRLNTQLEQTTHRFSLATFTVVDRPVPVWVHVRGLPAAGKTYAVTKRILPAVWKHLVTEGLVIDSPYSEAACVFTQCMKDDHQDAYGSQPLHFIDDLFQTKSPERRQAQALDIIHWVSTGACPILMADPKKKGTLYVSKLIISTGNESIIDVQNLGLSSKEAFESRCVLEVNMLDRNTFEITKGSVYDHDNGPVKIDHINISQLTSLISRLVLRAANEMATPGEPILPDLSRLSFEGDRGVSLGVPPINVVFADQSGATPTPQDGTNRTVALCVAAPTGFVLTLVSAYATGNLLVAALVSFLLSFGLYKGLLALGNWINPPANPAVKWGEDWHHEFYLDDKPTEEPQANHFSSKDPHRKGDKQRRRALEAARRRGDLAAVRELEEAESQVAESYNSQRVRNAYKSVVDNIGAMLDSKGTHLCFMFGVRGTTWLLPHHALEPGKYIFQRRAGVSHGALELELTHEYIREHVLSVSRDLDAAIISIPGLPSVADKLTMWTPSLPATPPKLLRFYPNTLDGERVVWTTLSARSTYVQSCPWNLGAAEMFNEKGMCGLPVIDYSTGKILGIHVAGVPTHRESYFACVTPTFLSDAIGVSEVEGHNLRPELQSFDGREIGSTLIYGEVIPQHRVKLNTASDYHPVPVPTPWPVESAPAKLAPFDLDGQEVSPYFKALDKYKETGPVPLIDGPNIDHLLFPTTSPSVLFPQLSWEEAVYGTEDGIRCIDFDKSQGPYLKTLHKTRAECFDRANRTIKPWFQEILDKTWQYTKEGRLPRWINDHLKDELRDNERVKQGKTRIFYIVDLANLIVCRRLFGRYVAVLESYPTKSACAVGINPTSVQWAELAERLGLSDEDRVRWTADHSNFDLRMAYPHQLYAASIIVPRLVPESRLQATNYLLGVGSQYHVGMKWYYVSHGINTSGEYLTSVIGTIINVGSVVDYLESVGVEDYRLTAYSDDLVLTIPKGTRANLNDCRDFIQRKWRLKWTAADKSDNLQEVSPQEVAFLSRTWVWTREAVWAPLPKSTIHGLLQWVTEVDPELQREQMISRTTTALTDAIQHGKSFYEEIQAQCLKVADYYNFSCRRETFERAKSRLLAAHYAA